MTAYFVFSHGRRQWSAVMADSQADAIQRARTAPNGGPGEYTVKLAPAGWDWGSDLPDYVPGKQP